MQRAPFGALLRRLREASGLSQEELAHRAGLTPNAVGTLERGERRRPYPNTVRAIAEALHLEDAERAELIASIPSRKRAAPAERTLPIPPTPLIGREQDVRALEVVLREGEARLITLTGPGGVGKTRLGVEVASRLAPTFPDGVLLVDLAPLGDRHLVLPTIAESLGVRETGLLREALRSVLASRRLLFIMDNFEHVLDAAVDIAFLLESCPELIVLVTSRSPLRIRGEHEYQVAPLEMPDPGKVPGVESVADVAAAQLFLQRAGEAAPGFSLNQNNAGTIAAICWRLEGLPLALELAAAQTRFIGPTTLLSRLDQVLQSAGARDLPPRQRTMRATLDWDHDLLSVQERTVFRRLGAFAGGFTLQAAEAVIKGETVSEEETFGLIGQLVEKSLVMAEDWGGRDTMRYRLLTPVREYSLQRLEESGEAHAVRSRHAEFFGALAEHAGAGLKRADQLMWLEVLSDEHDNLRAALGYLLERGDVDKGAQLGWNLWLFWSLRGHVTEGRGWMEALLGREGGSSRGRKRALWVLAMFFYMRADLDRMLGALDEVFSTDDGLDEDLPIALTLRGHGLSQSGDLDRAEDVLSRALKLARETDDQWTIPHALHGLAHVAMARQDIDSAERALVESLSVAREIGDRWSLAIGLTIHALAALLKGENELAASQLDECTALAIALGDPFTIAYSLTGLAVIAGRRGDGERMAHLAGAADALRETTAIDINMTVWRSLFDNEVDSVREQSGANDFDRAYSRGRLMAPEQLIGGRDGARVNGFPAPLRRVLTELGGKTAHE